MIKDERQAVVQGTGYTYAQGERTLLCMDGKTWSLTAPDRRWLLPPGDHRRLVHGRSMAVCYFTSLEAAEWYIGLLRYSKTKLLLWPDRRG